jgi:hypothetical protein
MAETPKPTPAQVAAGQARAGGTAPVVSTPKKKNKTKNKTKTSKQLVEYISSDLNTSGLPKGSTISKEKGLTDVGLGTPIRVGEGFRIPFNQPTVTYK